MKSNRRRLECEILLGFVLQKERIFLHAFDDKILTYEQFEIFSRLIDRACDEEPIEYLTQRVGFYGYEFEIIPGVLIPRPETEILVQKVKELIEDKQITRVFELGVGSGVISIVLALLCPEIHIIASEINPLAIKLAQRNIQRFATDSNSLQQRISLYEVDILKQDFVFEGIELLISNPPYIAQNYPLPKNVAYEPKDALLGGKNGDEILLQMIELVHKAHIPFLACEMGYDQKKSMQEALYDKADVEFFCDLNKHNRGFIAQFLQ